MKMAMVTSIYRGRSKLHVCNYYRPVSVLGTHFEKNLGKTHAQQTSRLS